MNVLQKRVALHISHLLPAIFQVKVSLLAVSLILRGDRWHRCGFFLSFFDAQSIRLLNSCHPNLDTHSRMTAIWNIWTELSRVFTPHKLETKNILRRLWTLTEHICLQRNGTWYQQSERNLSIYSDCPTRLQIWWTLVQKRLRTVGEFLPTRKFLHWETLPALQHGRHITDSRQTLACVI